MNTLNITQANVRKFIRGVDAAEASPWTIADAAAALCPKSGVRPALENGMTQLAAAIQADAERGDDPTLRHERALNVVDRLAEGDSTTVIRSVSTLAQWVSVARLIPADERGAANLSACVEAGVKALKDDALRRWVTSGVSARDVKNLRDWAKAVAEGGSQTSESESVDGGESETVDSTPDAPRPLVDVVAAGIANLEGSDAELAQIMAAMVAKFGADRVGEMTLAAI